MARNGSGVYSAPAGTEGVANTAIESAKYNAFVADLVADANAARPIVAGGTSATTAVGGADALSTQGSAIASATTTDLSAATGKYVSITGTTTITGFGTVAAGAERILVFAAALTLTHNATSLILPGAANITTAAGDVAVMVSEGSGNWRCISYSGNGQYRFPSTANLSSDPNTLDDYEEGDWTPTVTAGSGTITSYTSSGSYTKIGARTLFEVRITITDNGTASSSIVFTLPPGVTTTAVSAPVGVNTTSALTCVGILNNGGSSVALRRYDGLYPVATGQALFISGSYI